MQVNASGAMKRKPYLDGVTVEFIVFVCAKGELKKYPQLSGILTDRILLNPDDVSGWIVQIECDGLVLKIIVSSRPTHDVQLETLSY